MGKRGRQAVADHEPPLERLVTQVKMTNVLLAAQLLQHMTQSSIVGLLKSAGASIQDIADVLGTSYGTVAVQLGRIRKQSTVKGEAHGDAQNENAPETGLRETGDGPERSES